MKLELCEAVAAEWKKITMNDKIKLMESMRKRCSEIVMQNRMSTKYRIVLVFPYAL